MTFRHPALCAVFIATFGALVSTSGEDRKQIDFDRLIEIADSYGTPVPPPDSKLVLANSGSRGVVGNSSNSRDPGFYWPAFVISETSPGSVEVLTGWTSFQAETGAKHCPAIRTFSAERQTPKAGGYLAGFNDTRTFLTSIHLARKGQRELANQLWKMVRDVEYFRDVHVYEGASSLRKDPEKLLALCLYHYLYRAPLEPTAQLAEIHGKLVRLKREYPFLFSAGFYGERRRQFLDDLGETVSAPEAEKGSVEAQLIEWGNQLKANRKYGDEGLFQQSHRGYFDNAATLAILNRGTAGIRELAGLIDDRRLTRQVGAAVMKSPEKRIRLGRLAKTLLDACLGSQALEDLPTVEKLSPETERQFFEKAAASREKKITEFHAAPLYLLATRWPQSLADLAAAVPQGLEDGTSVWPLVSAIVHAAMAQEDKVALLTAMSSRTKGDRQRAILQTLVKVDAEATKADLSKRIAKLPKDIRGAYWTCDEANLMHIVAQSPDIEIWKAYLQKTRQASIGLRMELMNSINYSYLGDANLNLRIAFLAQFLTDTELRDRRSAPKKYTGPHAGFHFDKLRVQNFVAIKLASMLQLSAEEKPDEFWSDQQWSAYRSAITSALKKIDLPSFE